MPTPTTTPDTLTVTEYFCPTDATYSDCPGPCPDGRPHAPSRTRTIAMYPITNAEAIARGVLPPGAPLPPEGSIRASRP